MLMRPPRAPWFLTCALLILGCERPPGRVPEAPPARAPSTSSASSSGASEAATSRRQAPSFEDVVWEGEGSVQFGPAEELMRDGELVLQRQPWRFEQQRGWAWRVRLPRRARLEVVATSEVRPFEELVEDQGAGPWAALNGGFYETHEGLLGGGHRAMGLVRARGREVSPYRRRGGSGIVWASRGGPLHIWHHSRRGELSERDPTEALQSIDRIVSGGESLVGEKERARGAARSAVAITDEHVWLIALHEASGVRRFDGGARLLKTSYMGLPLWAFAAYVRDALGATEALNLDGAVSTQMMVRAQGEDFRVLGERGTINALVLRP